MTFSAEIRATLPNVCALLLASEIVVHVLFKFEPYLTPVNSRLRPQNYPAYITVRSQSTANDSVVIDRDGRFFNWRLAAGACFEKVMFKTFDDALSRSRSSKHGYQHRNSQKFGYGEYLLKHLYRLSPIAVIVKRQRIISVRFSKGLNPREILPWMFSVNETNSRPSQQLNQTSLLKLTVS
jgi:hypothetical protein